MRGLPWRATDEEVLEFFQDYKVKEGSLQFGQGEDGRRTGWGCILFENEDEAARACEEKNKQYIGERWIGTYNMNYGQWKGFQAQ